jgi:hypothetical protein
MGFKTRGEYLHFAIFLALADARKYARGLWFGLKEDERNLIATRAVEHIKQHAILGSWIATCRRRWVRPIGTAR